MEDSSETPTTPQPQRPVSQAEARARDMASDPAKSLGVIWLMVLVGLFQRFVMSWIAAQTGLLVVSVPLVLMVLLVPGYTVWSTFHFNKRLTDVQKFAIVGSAVVVTGFGIWVAAWAF